MKLILLLPSYNESTSAIKDLDVVRDITPFIPDGKDWQVETVFLDKRTAYSQLKKLKADVFVNLCDGSPDDDVPGWDVVLALESLGYAYTGCDSKFYPVTKDAMKLACRYADVRIPEFATVDSLSELDSATMNLNYPLIVKHRNGANSVGLTDRSKVNNKDELAEQVALILKEEGTALIEEFIDGREFAVLISANPRDPFSPFTYDPVEISFKGAKVNFKTFEFKWLTYDNTYTLVTDPQLAQELVEMTKAAWLTLDGNGYARSDIRMDKDGKLYFLEINTNPSILYAREFSGTADLSLYMGKVGHKEFLNRMIEEALERKRKQTPLYVIKYDAKNGVGSYAARDIKQGEILKEREYSPFWLVTGEHVKKHWPKLMQDYFKHNAYEICYDTFVVWDPDGTKTFPVNHSCDPTLVCDGLNDVALRDIKKGEHLTFDYSTYIATKINDFKCNCGAKECRGSWTPEDSLTPWFQARYGDNVHPIIKQFQIMHGKRAKL